MLYQKKFLNFSVDKPGNTVYNIYDLIYRFRLWCQMPVKIDEKIVRLIELVLSKGLRAEVIHTKDGVKVLSVKRERAKPK